MADAQTLKQLYPELAAFEITRTEDHIEFSAEGKSVASIDHRHNEWIVYSQHGHAHRDGEQQALEFLGLLLRAQARWVEEFRGETLAAAWIEVLEEDGTWTQQDVAAFLAPFDPDDWNLWPGETWRTVRTKWEVTPPGGFVEHVRTREADKSSFHPGKMLGWLDQALGPPLPGMKWTVGRDNRLVLQVPLGWRRKAGPEKGKTFVDFAPHRPGLLLRVANYYRPSAVPAPERKISIKPASREYDRTEATVESKGWASDQWNLTFPGNKDDMLAIIDLFEHESQAGSSVPVRKLLVDTLSEARYVPNDWDMSSERQQGP